MRPDVEAATKQVIGIRARLGSSRGRDVQPQEVDDALCEGYAQALAGDAWLTDSERRLHELIDDASREFRGRDLRALTSAHGEFQRRVIALRFELEALRREHDRLQTGSHASSQRAAEE